MSPEEFFRRYYFGHRPVVLRGLMEDWPALRRWSLPYFRERLRTGGGGGDGGARRQPGARGPSRTGTGRGCPSRTHLGQLETAGETNDFYMVPRNDNWRREGLAPLREDLRAPRGIIDPELRPDMMTLLLGPRAPSPRCTTTNEHPVGAR